VPCRAERPHSVDWGAQQEELRSRPLTEQAARFSFTLGGNIPCQYHTPFVITHCSRDWPDFVLMCLQLPTLGRVYGLLVISGQIPWKDLVSYAMLPYGEARFWTNASQHYRTFAVLSVAYALEVSLLTKFYV